jgi:phage pi2 protein 07
MIWKCFQPIYRKEFMMKTFKNMAAQGDLVIKRVADMPDFDVEEMKVENGVYVVAHSESGHNHVMNASTVTAFKNPKTSENDLYELFLKVDAPTMLDHVKTGPDQHEALLVPPGTYKIVRQREHTAEGFRRAQD